MGFDSKSNGGFADVTTVPSKSPSNHVAVGEAGHADGKVSHLGHEVELERNFSFVSAACMAFALLNSWTAMSASLSLVLPSGGPIAMVYGLLVSALGTYAMALSLAEVCHVYPLSGGQYHWAYLLAPPGYERGLAYFTGWMAAAGWISVAATGSSLGANFVIGIISFWHESFTSERYQIFLLYLAFTLAAWALNQFAVRALPAVDRTAFLWSVTGIIVVIITVLAVSSPNYQPAEFVFTRWINETGWPTGVAFILGLLQSTFGLTGFDAVTHMVEEMPNPSFNAPRVMILAITLGSLTSWIFVIVLLFVMTDIDGVISSAAGPLLTIYYQATTSRAGATCLLLFNVLAMFFATQGLLMIASRVCFSLARDRLFGPTSRPLSRVSPTWKVPTWALAFAACWIVIFGLIFLGSSVALNAILSASVVFLQISYIVPIALVLFRGHKALEPEGFPKRRLKLGIFRVPINLAGLVFATVTSIFFVFPPAIPVESGTLMNWVIVCVFVVLLMSGVNWLVDGKRNYRGPENVELLLHRAAQAAVIANHQAK